MKYMYVISLTFISVLLMVGCAHYPVAQQSGKEDVAYLLFVSQSNAKNYEVEVAVDNRKRFNAKTVKSRKAHRSGTQYSASVGRHKITVSYEGKVLYEKQIVLSAQEVKQITLP